MFTGLLATDETTLRPGVRRLVDEIRSADIWLGLITGTERSVLRALDTSLGEDFDISDFDVVIDRDVVSRTKLDPMCYRIALSSLSIGACCSVAIADTEARVLAVSAQVTCVATPNTCSEFQIVEGAVSSVTHLGNPDNAATQLSGIDVLDGGLVTVATLGGLLAEPLDDTGDRDARLS